MTPTEPEPSAFDDEAKELDKRLRQLIGDYAALFHRYPHVEGMPSVEALEKARVLATLRVHPWRKKLSAQAVTFERESLRDAGVKLRRKEDWWERRWIDNIPGIVARCERDVQCVARNLITTLPASLRIKCPGYPPLTDSDAIRTAAVAVASKIQKEVENSKRCKDPVAKTIGRLALKAMGYKGARNLRRLRT